MADHQVPSQQANPILANTYPHPALHQLQGQNPHVVGDHQGDFHREGIPHPVGNVAMQGEIQYPPHIDAPNYNAAHYGQYHPLPLHYPQGPQLPFVHMHRDDRVAEPVPAQAHPFAQEENYDDYGAYFPAPADPPEAYPRVRALPAPPADMPLAANGLRNLAERFLNNPGTLVNILRIEPGRDGRFEVWIALELADIYPF
ncbi:hypothetical protein V8E53_010882 [Lactarius tabidus]